MSPSEVLKRWQRLLPGVRLGDRGPSRSGRSATPFLDEIAETHSVGPTKRYGAPLEIVEVIGALVASAGTTESLLGTVQALVNQGERPTVICGPVEEKPAARLNRSGSAVFSYPGVGRWLVSPSMTVRMARTIRKSDVVHIHGIWMYQTTLAALMALVFRVPYIFRPAGSLEPGAVALSARKKRVFLALIQMPLLRRALFVQASAPMERDNLHALGIPCSKIEIVPNGFEPLLDPIEDRAVALASFGLDRSEKYVLFLGRIHQKKRPDLLISAMEMVRSTRPGMKLVVAGPTDSDYANMLMSESPPWVVFTGELLGTAKSSAYHYAELFALTSQSENFGIAVPEALSAGIPALTSDTMPWGSLERRGVGATSSLKSEDIASAILRLLEARSGAPDELAQLCREVASEYSWDRTARLLTHRIRKELELPE